MLAGYNQHVAAAKCLTRDAKGILGVPLLHG